MLSRPALARVLQSLLCAELAAARGGDAGARLPGPPPGPWPETLSIGRGATDMGLACDSLETLRLAAAVNEMFHLHEAAVEDALLADTTFGAWLDRIEAAWRAGAASVTFTTSGTTGRPKRCTHAGERLLTETAFLAGLFRDRSRVVSLVPAHHIYGFLFTALLPDALGTACLDAARLGAGALAAALAPGDLVVTFPERWRWLERSLPSWPADVEGTVSTAPCPPDLIAALNARGLLAMTEVYGSSETAGVAVRRRPEGCYRLMPHWRFAEPLDPAAPEVIHRSGWRIALPDRIAREGDDGFRLAGRRDGAVQVGGINVFVAHVAARLRARPGVGDAAVRLMRPDEGARLKAFVVPAPDTCPDALRRDLQAWIDASLPTPERPVALTLGPRLPSGATGKPADW